LHGNVRADLTPSRDLGPVEDSLPLRLYLVLQRSPAQQAALDLLLARQQQPTAAEYHQWLTPRQFGERFGASEQDISKITEWLEAQGMHVNGVTNNASFIDFSATGRDVREVFHTQLHYYNVGGGKYPALASDPMLPAALAPIVAGISGLNKIPAHPNHTAVKQASYDETTHLWHNVELAAPGAATPAYLTGGGDYDVTPQDFYTIYNVNPTFNAGTKGANSTVAVIEESDIVYGTVNSTTQAATGGDVATFRTLFGVSGTLNMHVYHGYGTVTCNDPGIDPNGDGEEGEAALDAEWASALAPAANLIFMSCDQSPNQGIISSEMALIDNNLSDVMSLSYGNSELNFTTSNYSAQDTLLNQAAAQGQSFIVSAGDSGSDVRDQNTAGTATHGINVSGFASSPFVTVAGGTDFVDVYDQHQGGPLLTTYWSSTNSAYYGNALGYVPETAWNSSCASSIIAAYFGYTGAGLCATGSYTNGEVVGGSGGFSTHYSVPSYQSGITGYSGTMRAQPDISSFASAGPWGHALIFCDSHVAGTACASSATFGTAGGTSFVAPQFAGIGGLLVSYTGTRQGLLNPALYALAKAQFTATATQSSCYSNGQTSNTGVTTSRPISTCTFNDVTSSNNDVPCAAGSLSCYVNTGAGFGMLSRTGSASLSVAFPSTPGYDEVTGIGTLNVNNLLVNWHKAFTSTTYLSASLLTITTAQSTKLTASVNGGSPPGYIGGKMPTLAGTVSFAAGTTALGSCTLSSGTCSLTVNGSALLVGSNSITATFAGSKTYPSSVSTSITVSVTGSSAPVATLSATTLNFNTETVGVATAAQSVTLTNTGNATLNITSITLGGTAPTSFVVTANTCGTTLAAAANCSISAEFKPTVTGPLSATIAIVDNAANTPQVVALSGTGATSTGILSLSTTSLTYGTENIGAISPGKFVTVKNSGTATLTINSFSFSGTNPTSFGQLDNCHSTLGAGAQCYSIISLAPQATGSLSATYNVSTSVGAGSVALTGTGIPTAALSFSPSPINFPTTLHGTQSVATIMTVTNTGTSTATFTFIGIGGTNYADFYQLNSCGATLAAGATCKVFVIFTPAAAATYTATLEFFDTAQNEYQGVTLNGTGN
jgi:subtilase family serine protease